MTIKPAVRITSNERLLLTIPQAQLTGMAFTALSEMDRGITPQQDHYRTYKNLTGVNPVARHTYRGAKHRENLIGFILHQPIRIAPPSIKKHNNYTGI